VKFDFRNMTDAISFTPGFSPVAVDEGRENRFTGFPRARTPERGRPGRSNAACQESVNFFSSAFCIPTLLRPKTGAFRI